VIGDRLSTSSKVHLIGRHYAIGRMPTTTQLQCLYRISYHLTYRMLQPIHLVCVDARSQNLYVLAGQNEEIEFEVAPNGEVL